jgi:hypothetical protein
MEAHNQRVPLVAVGNIQPLWSVTSGYILDQIPSGQESVGDAIYQTQLDRFDPGGLVEIAFWRRFAGARRGALPSLFLIAECRMRE